MIVSKCNSIYSKFSKELYKEVCESLDTMTDSEWDENESGYKRVSVAVYVRTDFDNLVLKINGNKIAKILDSVQTSIKPTPLFMLDVGMFTGRTLINELFDLSKPEVAHKFATNSTCYPVGAVETKRDYVLVFSVVMSSSLLTDPDIKLKQGHQFTPIETLELEDSVQKMIAESLVLVK